MTPDLKELERLARAATPGPLRMANDAGKWSANYDDLGSSCYQAIKSQDGEVVFLAVAQSPSIQADPDTRANAAYMTAAFNAMPSLIAELTRPETTLVSIMRAELEQAKKDSRRVDWIALQGDEFKARIVFDGPHDGETYVSGAHSGAYGENIRAAIDAAIAKESA